MVALTRSQFISQTSSKMDPQTASQVYSHINIALLGPVFVRASSLTHAHGGKLTTLDYPGLDRILGGGIDCSAGSLTEIFGRAGCGKTNLALQLCLAVQLPRHQGGREAGAIYLSTEGGEGFPSLRLESMYKALTTTIITTASVDDITTTTSDSSFLLPEYQDCLENIIVVEEMDQDTQLHTIRYRLDHILETRKIGLIVLDSVAALFRGHGESSKSQLYTRQKDFYALAAMLKQLGAKHGAAIVCINQVTDSFSSASSLASSSTSSAAAVSVAARRRFVMENGQSSFEISSSPTTTSSTDRFVPSLNYTWSCMVNTRIGLSKSYEPGTTPGSLIPRRRFHLLFSPSAPDAVSGGGGSSSRISVPVEIRNYGMVAVGEPTKD